MLSMTIVFLWRFVNVHELVLNILWCTSVLSPEEDAYEVLPDFVRSRFCHTVLFLTVDHAVVWVYYYETPTFQCIFHLCFITIDYKSSVSFLQHIDGIFHFCSDILQFTHISCNLPTVWSINFLDCLWCWFFFSRSLQYSIVGAFVAKPFALLIWLMASRQHCAGFDPLPIRDSITLQLISSQRPIFTCILRTHQHNPITNLQLHLYRLGIS